MGPGAPSICDELDGLALLARRRRPKLRTLIVAVFSFAALASSGCDDDDGNDPAEDAAVEDASADAGDSGGGGDAGDGAADTDAAPDAGPAALESSVLGCHTDVRTEIPLPTVLLPGFGPAEPVEDVNTACPEDAPEISGNGRRLYLWYQTFHDATGIDMFEQTEIRVFERTAQGWDGPFNYPVDLGTRMSIDGEVSHTSVGDFVYFQSMRPENIDWGAALPMDVYVAEVVDGVPRPASLMAPPVSTEALDGEMAVSRDGTELFVASDRDDPGGTVSLYLFRRQGEAWVGPDRLAGEVNDGPKNMQPFLTADGSTLLFTTLRRGFPEIWSVPRLGDNEWGTPEPAVGNALAGSPSMTDDGQTFCFAALTNHPAGGFEADIYCADSKGDGAGR